MTFWRNTDRPETPTGVGSVHCDTDRILGRGGTGVVVREKSLLSLFAVILVLASCGSVDDLRWAWAGASTATLDIGDKPDTGPDACNPSCEAEWCGGDDGCGGRCTRCPENSVCNHVTWVCDCPGVWCGGNCCQSGQTCGPGDSCVGGCVPNCIDKQCGDDGCSSNCGSCSGGKLCDNGQCVCVSHDHKNCSDGDVYWYDSCGKREDKFQDCQYGCSTGQCHGCQPNCMGKECGDDGCGGSCGTCPDDGDLGSKEYCDSNGSCQVQHFGYFDTNTSLLWQLSPPAGQMSQPDGYQYCKGLSLGGYDDWYLPTISEYRHLINCPATQYGGACNVTNECQSWDCKNEDCGGCSDGGPDGGCWWPEPIKSRPGGNGCEWYWSETVTTGVNNQGWEVGFYWGKISEDSRDNLKSIRCVR